ELGQLARPGVLEARLRQTALAYLRVGGSARRAATELGLHKNTVLYRLRQIEQVLGRSLTERRLPTELALMLAEAYQGRVLTGRLAAAVPRVTRELQGPAARRRIVDAAWRLVSSNGVSAATMRAIALEAGVSTGAVTHYFVDKAEV